jgi:predicted negative regulator of RcsB-dependent stress response
VNEAFRNLEEIRMKTFVIGLVLILAGIVGLSFWRGWIQFTSDKAADKPSVTLTVDKEKIQDDKNKAVGTAQDLGRQAKDKATAATQKAKNQEAADASKR